MKTNISFVQRMLLFANLKVITLFILSVFWASSCKDKDEPIVFDESSKMIELHKDFTHTVKLKTGNHISWESGNEFVAKVEDGVVTGKHIGTTTIFAKNDEFKDDAIVNVIPLYFIYDQPILDFGITKDELVQKETHVMLSTVEEDMDLAYDYNYDKYQFMVAYSLGDNHNSLTHVVVAGGKKSNEDFTDDELQEIVNFYAERYAYAGQDENKVAYFINNNINNATMLVGVVLTKKVLLTNYFSHFSISFTYTLSRSDFHSDLPLIETENLFKNSMNGIKVESNGIDFNLEKEVKW